MGQSCFSFPLAFNVYVGRGPHRVAFPGAEVQCLERFTYSVCLLVDLEIYQLGPPPLKLDGMGEKVTGRSADIPDNGDDFPSTQFP